ncbi:hypothetical protein NDU88_004597 [Pleurodeles waltl]|uniref:Uncharacterized protein n=1 Tax=Pleurodeles waltl TaxID=8319 RepID=A0AAV7M6R7_PLEWA|nr:hypothetical protein NDU88_004597 [Pleurodeles waltl]
MRAGYHRRTSGTIGSPGSSEARPRGPPPGARLCGKKCQCGLRRTHGVERRRRSVCVTPSGSSRIVRRAPGGGVGLCPDVGGRPPAVELRSGPAWRRGRRLRDRGSRTKPMNIDDGDSKRSTLR